MEPGAEVADDLDDEDGLRCRFVGACDSSSDWATRGYLSEVGDGYTWSILTVKNSRLTEKSRVGFGVALDELLIIRVRVLETSPLVLPLYTSLKVSNANNQAGDADQDL